MWFGAVSAVVFMRVQLGMATSFTFHIHFFALLHKGILTRPYGLFIFFHRTWMHLAPDEWIGVHETRRAHPDASHTHRLILDGLTPPPLFLFIYILLFGVPWSVED